MPISWPFPLPKTDSLPDPCPWFPLGSPTLNFGSDPPCPVTRQGVRGLIICTDPGLSPRGGCLGTVALDPIDTVRGRRRGEENRPWLQSVGPPRQVDECPGLHDLCHPSQWSQATMSYSLLVREPSCPPPPPPPPPQPAHESRSPPRTRAGQPPSLHKHWRSILDCSAPHSCHHLPRPFNSRPWLRRFSPATHTHRSNHKLALVTPACHYTSPLAAYVSRLQHWCIQEPDTWLF